MKTIETTTTVSTKDFDFRQTLEKIDDARKQVKEFTLQLESFCKQFTEIERYKPKENSSGTIEILPVLKVPEGYEVECTARMKTILDHWPNIFWFIKKNDKGEVIDKIKVIVENTHTFLLDQEDIKVEVPFDEYYLRYPGRIKFNVILGYVARCDGSNVYTVLKDIDEKDVISALEKRYKKAK